MTFFASRSAQGLLDPSPGCQNINITVDRPVMLDQIPFRGSGGHVPWWPIQRTMYACLPRGCYTSALRSLPEVPGRMAENYELP